MYFVYTSTTKYIHTRIVLHYKLAKKYTDITKHSKVGTKPIILPIGFFSSIWFVQRIIIFCLLGLQAILSACSFSSTASYVYCTGGGGKKDNSLS